jgi:hypothetical protein
MKQQHDLEFYKKAYDKRPKKSKYREHFEMVRLEMDYERALKEVSKHSDKFVQDDQMQDE